MTSGFFATHPQGSFVNFICITEFLIYFRFSMWVKVSQGNPSGRLLREQSQILPIDSGESPPILIDESPQFHAISCPPDKVQSCFAVKETAFQFGYSNFPAGRTRSYTCMDWSLAISIALDHSKRLREHGVCQKPATSLIFPLPKCGAEFTICTSHP